VPADEEPCGQDGAPASPPLDEALEYNPDMFSERTSWKLAQNRLTETLDGVRRKGARILDLTVSNPTRVGLQYDAPAILNALASPEALDYDPQAKGLRTAREAVAAYYRSDHSCDLDPEHIILTTSTSEGYSLVFRLLSNPGDELLVPKPSYPLFEFLADLQDVKLVPYPLIYDHGWQIDFHSLEKAVSPRTRAVVVVHPNNPTGSYIKRNELQELNALCRKLGLCLIVDEVFLDYGLGREEKGHEKLGHEKPGHEKEDHERHATFATNAEVLTFTLSGLSKISALPQIKVAWVATSGPGEEVSAAMARLEVIADTYLSMNAPVQWAVPRLLEQRHDIQQQLLVRVNANLAELDRQLAAQKSCERLCLEGGWYAVLRVPVTRSDEDLCIELLKSESVLLHPGHFYDFASDGYLVLSLIGPQAEFREGIEKVLRMLDAT
jgi:alanine-synthesizing transaminase